MQYAFCKLLTAHPKTMICMCNVQSTQQWALSVEALNNQNVCENDGGFNLTYAYRTLHTHTT